MLPSYWVVIFMMILTLFFLIVCLSSFLVLPFFDKDSETFEQGDGSENKLVGQKKKNWTWL